MPPPLPHPLSRRDFLQQLALGATGLCLGSANAASSPGRRPDGERPNIVLILADDLGFSDLGCFGSTVIETPNLDRLAAGGTRFTQFYNNAKCAPSRASLLTGLYAQQTGCHGPPARLENSLTLAEALRPAGYRTWMSGKWHAAETPFQRGFERAYGLCDGHNNFWTNGYADPDGKGFTPDWAERRRARWAVDGEEFTDWKPPSPEFYTTDAFTDAAVGYVRDAAHDPSPFFLHLAYTAPHFPLHAHPEDIAKYRGRFRHGWEEERERRLTRQRELGLLDPRWPVAPRDERVPAWASVADPADWDLRMAVYAAMIERMDRGIGRLVAALKATGRLDDTLIVFLSDNGGCAEEYNLTPDLAPGPKDSFRTLDIGWASATNTPFRKFKNWDHEGGICTPAIAHWPGHVPAGRIAHDVGHFIDFMPTCLELAGATYPGQHRGQAVLPPEGRSLVPLLTGGSTTPDEPRLLCWQFGSAAAARRGPWKIVRRGRQNPWELYEIETDRTETRDLAAARPQIVTALSREWHAWATRVGAKI